MYTYIGYIFETIHLLMDTCCFHISAIVNNATQNIDMRVFFQICVFLFFGYIPRSGILDCMLLPFLIFEKSPIMFSTVVVLTYIPTNSAGGFPFLHILTNTCYLLSYCLFFFFWLCLLHVPRPGIKPVPQQQPKLLKRKCQIHNLLHHNRTPVYCLFEDSHSYR